MKITIDVYLPDTPLEVIRGVLRDALAEFCNQRTPAAAYVARRYPDGAPRTDKVSEVEGRVRVAKTLLHNVHTTFNIEE